MGFRLFFRRGELGRGLFFIYFFVEVSVWIMICVGCYDNEIEIGINNSYLVGSLILELICYY